MKRIDPDAMYDWCRMMERVVGMLDKPSLPLTTAFPEVAEPPKHSADPDDERKYPCRMCGTMRSKAEGGTTFTVCDKCWDKKHGPFDPEPAEPVIDEADEDFVYVSDTEVGISGCLNLSEAGEIIEKQARMIRELRSNACGSKSVGSSSDSSSTKSSAEQSAAPAAPAADPRRLTDSEIWSAYLGAGSGALRAVADAQFAKDRVTISEAEISRCVPDCLTRHGRIREMIALLRSKGVEVTP